MARRPPLHDVHPADQPWLKAILNTVAAAQTLQRRATRTSRLQPPAPFQVPQRLTPAQQRMKGGGASIGHAVRTAGHAVYQAIPSFPDDRYANARGRAEAGRPYSTAGLSPQHAANVRARERAGAAARKNNALGDFAQWLGVSEIGHQLFDAPARALRTAGRHPLDFHPTNQQAADVGASLQMFLPGKGGKPGRYTEKPTPLELKLHGENLRRVSLKARNPGATFHGPKISRDMPPMHHDLPLGDANTLRSQHGVPLAEYTRPPTVEHFYSEGDIANYVNAAEGRGVNDVEKVLDWMQEDLNQRWSEVRQERTVRGSHQAIPNETQIKQLQAQHRARQINPLEASPAEFKAALQHLNETELLNMLNTWFSNVSYSGPPTGLMIRRDMIINRHGDLRQRAIRRKPR